METSLDVIQGFEDIGVRFSMSDIGGVRIILPENIELSDFEIGILKELKSDILLAISNGETLS